jgi:protein-L-isoaspartate(D-aspartate) O-methyltransferase
MNLETARFNMVEQQIRTWDVLNQRILELVAQAPREDYVPAAYRNLAFADMNIPIGHHQTMMQPKMEARLLQELEIKPSDKILEIGTGSGFLTSLLATLGKQVYSVELYPDFSRTALEALAQHQHKNVTLEVGDAATGWDRHGPYDVIVLTGSVPVLPESFKQSLISGGRLFAVVGNAPAMDAIVIQRVGNGFSERSVFETVLPALVNAKAPVTFDFYTRRYQDR